MIERLTADISRDLRASAQDMRAEHRNTDAGLLTEAADKLDGLIALLAEAEAERDEARAQDCGHDLEAFGRQAEELVHLRERLDIAQTAYLAQAEELAEARADNDRLRVRIHEAVVEADRRYAKYVSRCAHQAVPARAHRMTALLCANPRCAIPRRHRDGCTVEQCRGCLPGWAADGLRLCEVCTRRLGENAAKAGDLHGELELMLRPAGVGGQASGKPGSASPPRDAVVAMRTEIRHVLVSYAQLIHDERGHTLPADTVPAIAAYVRTNTEWLAAHEGVAGAAADELAGLVSRAWGLAYPSGTRRVEVGPCPCCTGTLTATVRATDQTLPSEVACDSGGHRWTADQWRQLDRLVMAKRRAA